MTKYRIYNILASEFFLAAKNAVLEEMAYQIVKKDQNTEITPRRNDIVAKTQSILT